MVESNMTPKGLHYAVTSSAARAVDEQGSMSRTKHSEHMVPAAWLNIPTSGHTLPTILPSLECEQLCNLGQ